MTINWRDVFLPLVAAVAHCGQQTTIPSPPWLLYGMFPSFFASITVFFISFPCVIHVFILSCSLLSLKLLFFSNCPSLSLKQSFIHTSLHPFSYPTSILIPFSPIPSMPCSLLASSLSPFCSPIPSFFHYFFISFCSFFLCPTFLRSFLHNFLFLFIHSSAPYFFPSSKVYFFLPHSSHLPP